VRKSIFVCSEPHDTPTFRTIVLVTNCALAVSNGEIAIMEIEFSVERDTHWEVVKVAFWRYDSVSTM
jgi:hypothetical protein